MFSASLTTLKIQQLKPEFSNNLSLADIISECEEVVWLRAIKKLTCKDVNINPNYLDNFTAILITQIHQLFLTRRKWEKEHRNFIFENIHAAFQSSNPLNSLTKTFTYLKKYENAVCLAADFTFHDLNFYLKTIENTTNLTILHKEIFYQINYNLFKKSINNKLNFFDMNEIKKINQLKENNIYRLSIECDLENHSNELVQRHNEYIQFNEDFIILFNDTLNYIKNLFPEFDPDKFSACYQKALETLKNDKNKLFFVDEFLYELCAQQELKKEFSTDLEVELCEKYIPFANKYYSEENLNIYVTRNRVAQWVAENNYRSSLHQIVENAYAHLHSTPTIVENYTEEHKKSFTGTATIFKSNMEIYGQEESLSECEKLFQDLSKNDDVKTESLNRFKLALEKLPANDARTLLLKWRDRLSITNDYSASGSWFSWCFRRAKTPREVIDQMLASLDAKSKLELS